MPQLDALRAFAVLLVVWHHWFGPQELGLGPMGVWIFFVISGFLITRILLNSKGTTPRENRSALVRFYVRRFLRIFPLYYFVLLVALFTSAAFRADWRWYVSYLQNFFMMRASADAHLFGVHFWTLAVEEQFYFCWPLLVLFVPRFVLGPVIAGAMAIGVVSRVSCTALGWEAFQVYALTPSNLDTLALGALLAYVVTHRPEKLRLLRRIALAGGILMCAATLLVHVRTWNAGMMPLPTALIALWFVSRVQEGFRGWFGWMMSFSTTVYLGRISYGIYVYHYFIPAVLQPLSGRFHIAEGSAGFGLICFAATMAAASASWFFFEKPINALKNRFRGEAFPWPLVPAKR